MAFSAVIRSCKGLRSLLPPNAGITELCAIRVAAVLNIVYAGGEEVTSVPLSLRLTEGPTGDQVILIDASETRLHTKILIVLTLLKYPTLRTSKETYM